GLVVAAIAVALGVRRRHPALAFFMGFSFLTLLPAANLLRLIGSIMAERFLYLPSVGFAACLVISVYAACRRPPAAGAFLAALILAYGVRTWARNRDWRDDLSLSLTSVAAAPASFKLHHGLARAHRL